MKHTLALDLQTAIILRIGSAQTAAESGIWSTVIDCLQTLPIDDIINDGIGGQVVDLALQVLINGDFQEQWDIAKIIPKLGVIALQPLLEIVNDTNIDLEERWFVARILGEFKQPQVVAALVELVKQGEDEELLAIATGALAKIGTPAIAALADLLNTPDRALAVKALAQIRHSETIEPLLQAIDDGDPQIRTLAIEALSSFHDRRIPPILLAKLSDLAPSVRQAAVVGLSLRSDAVELDLVKHLRPLLFDLNLAVCEATALGLARFPDPIVVEILTQVLRSSHTPDSLRSQVVLALGWIGSVWAIDSLATALITAPTDLAREILTSISKTEQERVYASQLLISYLNSLSGERSAQNRDLAIVKQEIAAALGNLGNIDAVPNLVQLLAEPNDRVRFYTISAIFKLSPTIPPEVLQLADRSDIAPELQIGVRMCLSHWKISNKSL